ncbi:hypothetical protein OCU04_008819 [Sclerotinia nivalis]|uniref:Uncharacterized protein n=1 Tax=Sclerotinia nivalis TaxID=352851 RepID=A0A9X0AG91_9HELO|nr:hypothetical protein OCU04_008819 [Sclerotinia nivalis]
MEKEIYRNGLMESGDTNFYALIAQAHLAEFLELRGHIGEALKLQQKVFRKFEEEWGNWSWVTHALAIDLYHMLSEHGYIGEADKIFLKYYKGACSFHDHSDLVQL